MNAYCRLVGICSRSAQTRWLLEERRVAYSTCAPVSGSVATTVLDWLSSMLSRSSRLPSLAVACTA